MVIKKRNISKKPFVQTDKKTGRRFIKLGKKKYWLDVRDDITERELIKFLVARFTRKRKGNYKGRPKKPVTVGLTDPSTVYTDKIKRYQAEENLRKAKEDIKNNTELTALQKQAANMLLMDRQGVERLERNQMQRLEDILQLDADKLSPSDIGFLKKQLKRYRTETENKDLALDVTKKDMIELSKENAAKIKELNKKQEEMKKKILEKKKEEIDALKKERDKKINEELIRIESDPNILLKITQTEGLKTGRKGLPYTKITGSAIPKVWKKVKNTAAAKQIIQKAKDDITEKYKQKEKDIESEYGITHDNKETKYKEDINVADIPEDAENIKVVPAEKGNPAGMVLWTNPPAFRDPISSDSETDVNESDDESIRKVANVDDSDDEAMKKLIDQYSNVKGSGKSNDDGLSEDQIDDIMKRHDSYLGTIARDEIESKILPLIRPHSRGSFVMNLDPRSKKGSHWVSVYFDARPQGSKSIEYFDSFSGDPPKGMMQDLKQIVDKLDSDTYLKFKVNRAIRQTDNSNNCGYHATKFIIDRMRGKTFPEATGYHEKLKDISKSGEEEIQKFKKQHGGCFQYI